MNEMQKYNDEVMLIIAAAEDKGFITAEAADMLRINIQEAFVNAAE